MNIMPKKTRNETITDLYNGTLFIQYETTDFQKTISFYKEGLNLEQSDFSKQTSPDKVGLVEFDLPTKGAILSLSKTTVDKIKLNESLVIMVKDIDKLKKMLTTRQITTTEITDVPNLLSFMRVNDPDGNTVMFISDPRKKN